MVLAASGRLSVTNGGPTVPPETLSQLATRFTRAGSQAEGSGLGVAIVATIAERIGTKLSPT